MKISNKTAAVISAAVINYISTEEKQAGLQGAQPLAAPGALTTDNIWGISGRQDIMQMRSLMQFRAFNRRILR